ncbi:hypothetical protein CsatB_010437 [Cannabis sativa]
MPPIAKIRVHLTESIRVKLCRTKKSNPTWSQKDLAEWLEKTHGLKVTQATISKTLKRSSDLLQEDVLINPNAKHPKIVKYPAMESALYEWFVCYQEHVNMSGDLLKEKGNFFLKKLYPEATSFVFSNGWLEKFKQRIVYYNYCSYN